MGGYDIGITGIQAAQSALDVIGNNIANAATEGYHRQEVDLRPRSDMNSRGALIGQGVDFAAIKRHVDNLLDQEIVRQDSTVSQIARQLEALRMIESAFAELTSSALSSAMDGFFSALHDLSSKPTDPNLQNMVISGAETLTFRLRNMSSNLTTLDERMYSEAGETVEQINLLATQIGRLNGEIQKLSITGRDPNNTLDQRAALISQLGELVGIKIFNREHNVVDITVGDMPLILGTHTSQLEVGLVYDSGRYDLGLGVVGTDQYSSSITGGRLGALFNVRNTIVRDVDVKLDTLARTIISEVNRLHVEGVGAAGSFTVLTGRAVSSEALSDFDPPLSDGTIHIRITDPSGNVSRESFTVDVSTHSLSDIAAWLGGLTGINSGATAVNGGKLQIQAEAGYKFDFLAGALEDIPASGADNTMAGFAGSAPPLVKVSGGYTGTVDETYTCTVKTTPPAQTGLTIGSGSMVLEVTNSSAEVVATINIGNGYVPGTRVELDNGIKISLGVNGSSAGYLNDGELFRIEALAQADSSGVLAAAGINTFFTGSDAASIDIRDEIRASGGLIAVAGTVAQTDNHAILAMARLGERSLSALEGLTPKSYYRGLVTDIGSQISINEIKYEDAAGISRNLRKQRDSSSGVDLNVEATQMMVYDRMFQSMAKYLSMISRTYDSLLTIMY